MLRRFLKKTVPNPTEAALTKPKAPTSSEQPAVKPSINTTRHASESDLSSPKSTHKTVASDEQVTLPVPPKTVTEGFSKLSSKNARLKEFIGFIEQTANQFDIASLDSHLTGPVRAVVAALKNIPDDISEEQRALILQIAEKTNEYIKDPYDQKKLDDLIKDTQVLSNIITRTTISNRVVNGLQALGVGLLGVATIGLALIGLGAYVAFNSACAGIPLGIDIAFAMFQNTPPIITTFMTPAFVFGSMTEKLYDMETITNIDSQRELKSALIALKAAAEPKLVIERPETNIEQNYWDDAAPSA